MVTRGQVIKKTLHLRTSNDNEPPDENDKDYDKKKMMTMEQVRALIKKPKGLHRRQLPPPPRHSNELDNRKKNSRLHALYEEFRAAEQVHLQSHKEMKSWREVPLVERRGKQLLDCMWVYTYKFDKL